MNSCVDTVFNLSTNLILTSEITEASCVGFDGAIDITVSGGQSPYSFSWKEEFYLFGINFGFQQFSTNEDLSNLGTGTYVLEVYDVSGCYLTDTFNTTYEILISANVIDNACYGDSEV